MLSQILTAIIALAGLQLRRATNRDKAGLDIFWLRDQNLEESDNLPDPDVLAQEIVQDLEVALEQFREIATDLGPDAFTAKEQ